MFGMEKGKEESASKTIFEMETDLKKHPHKKKELLTEMHSQLEHLKGQLRKGSKHEEFENMGFVLHGYSALIKVIDRIN
ncbi:MAG: hypothetical protein S4CHLAM7_04910 [Chlamydiae bacterium]|nr:hypothetical protein [Chlamydiota bacterium]